MSSSELSDIEPETKEELLNEDQPEEEGEESPMRPSRASKSKALEKLSKVFGSATRLKTPKSKSKKSKATEEIGNDLKFTPTPRQKGKAAKSTPKNDLSSYISSFMPSDKSIAQKKKKDIPILTEKTLASLSGNFSRKTPSRYSKSNKRKTPIAPVDLKRLNNLMGPAKKVKKAKSKEDDDEIEDEFDVDDEPKKKRGSRKRILDEVDLESMKKSLRLRARFSHQEQDMLAFIRSVSFFLNPVHRIWFDASVMRDIMHEYVPESRSKTVSILLASSAREMARPGRNAYLQYIVKTLCSNEEMIEIRDRFAKKTNLSDEEKAEIFWEAFKAAYNVVFVETEELPNVAEDDVTFSKFVEDEKFTMLVVDSKTNLIFPRRARTPQSIADIQHCVAFNVIMSTLVVESCRLIDDEDEMNEDGPRIDLLLNTVTTASLSETMEIARSDGLICKVRGQKMIVNLKRNQSTITVYYRHFFNHPYRKDLVDLLKGTVSNTPIDTNKENPAVFVHMMEYMYDSEGKMAINIENALEVIASDPTKGGGKAVKNMRHLKNAPIRLENIDIGFAPKDENYSIPSREDVLRIVGPIYTCNSIEDPAELENALISEGLESEIPDAILLFNIIYESEHFGVPMSELKEKCGLNLEDFDQILNAFIKIGAAFPCGVDVFRIVCAEFSSPWFIKTESTRFSPRPWLSLRGTVNWIVLRWMSESCLMTIQSKPGIKMEDLNVCYSTVLSPVLVNELVDFLVEIGCCSVKVENCVQLTVSSPFSSDSKSTKAVKYVVSTTAGFSKFAAFFLDTELPAHLFASGKKS